MVTLVALKKMAINAETVSWLYRLVTRDNCSKPLVSPTRTKYLRSIPNDRGGLNDLPPVPVLVD